MAEVSDTLIAALARAQAAMQHPKKSKTNPHFKSTYADLADVLNAVRPALNEQGIAVVQTVADGDLVTQLRLGADVIESRIPLNLDVKPQELGSQLSYLRRYALSAIAGVASEDDDDGNAASTAKPRARVPKHNEAPYRENKGPAVNDDGEPLATKDQQAEFVALCEACELDKQDRADFVRTTVERTAWKDVTKADAAALIAALKGEGWETYQAGDGKWHAVKAGEEPFDLEPPAESPVSVPRQALKAER